MNDQRVNTRIIIIFTNAIIKASTAFLSNDMFVWYKRAHRGYKKTFLLTETYEETQSSNKVIYPQSLT